VTDHQEESDALKAVRRYAPTDPDEQRRAFVAVMVIGDSEGNVNADQLVKKCVAIDQWLKDGTSFLDPRPKFSVVVGDQR
jgi:hypothetical protein